MTGRRAPRSSKAGRATLATGGFDVRLLDGAVVTTGRPCVDPANVQALPDWAHLDLGPRPTDPVASAPRCLGVGEAR
ncbi:hypothetical protein ACRBEV_03410 [Methylobacterium phyllosphaerae]